ncbi:MAG: metal-dependent transcriptional regulator [Candidatus Cyclobacteriaceae bacterium M3_2C_046]
MLSYAEENYLKAIYRLSEGGQKNVSTNSIAEVLQTKPASVSDMIGKLAHKKVINYIKYQGVDLSDLGKKEALRIIRKHRLWEVFLVEKLKFNWDEVHDVAEQLEHIRSTLLIRRLDEFLGYPQYDPHGDPIPDESGEFKEKPQIPLQDFVENSGGIIVAVNDTRSVFLQYLDKIGAYIGAKVKVISKEEFDGSMQILIDNKKTVFISSEVSENILLSE